MSDHVYSISEIVGSSTESVDDAIRKAVRSTRRRLQERAPGSRRRPPRRA